MKKLFPRQWKSHGGVKEPEGLKRGWSGELHTSQKEVKTRPARPSGTF